MRVGLPHQTNLRTVIHINLLAKFLHNVHIDCAPCIINADRQFLKKNSSFCTRQKFCNDKKIANYGTLKNVHTCTYGLVQKAIYAYHNCTMNTSISSIFLTVG